MSFSYSVAASYIEKDRPYDPAKHVFHFNPHNRIYPQQPDRRSQRPQSGQDAFFVSRMGGTAGGVALGVADGVGGWMDSGVDPADFSHGLCGSMAALAHDHRPPVPAPLTARGLMQAGYDAVCASGAVQAGGSTAVVGILRPEGTLEVANLGDSGFVQLRPNAVHAASTPQVHAFNTPFQLSVIPPRIIARVAAFGGAQLSDTPRDAEVSRHALRHGDVLVFASDGVWDNLFNQDILRIVSENMAAFGAWEATDSGTRVAADLRPFTSPIGVVPGAAAAAGSPPGLEGSTGADADAIADGQQQQQQPSRQVATLQSILATHITAAAKAASVNRKLDGPFSKEVKKYYPQESWRGGKVDDICVVVVVVSEEGGASSTPVKVKSRL